MVPHSFRLTVTPHSLFVFTHSSFLVSPFLYLFYVVPDETFDDLSFKPMNPFLLLKDLDTFTDFNWGLLIFCISNCLQRFHKPSSHR